MTMADTDVLDLLFDTNNGLLGTHCEKGQQSDNMMPAEDLALGDIDWSQINNQFSLPLTDDLDLFGPLLDTNLPDDMKQKQLVTQQNHVNDHAYSASASSPRSDSGISNGPYSPSNSSSGVEDVGLSDLWERELFEPLGLDKDTDFPVIDDMMMDAFSDNSSTSPALAGSESPASFCFDDLIDQQSPSDSTDAVNGITICTNEATKVVKVVSINPAMNNRRAQSLINPGTNYKSQATSQYPELRLSDEEKDLLRKEGISLPTHLPLTREEEKLLRSVRRRIRNKASARNSRKKKQDYMEALEERVKLCTDEKRQLQRKVSELEKKNTTLMGQLRKLQKLVTDGTRQTARTGTCAMILALSFALVAFPNFQSLTNTSSTDDTSLSKAASQVSGRTGRNLLSKSDDLAGPVKEDVSFNYMPFLKFSKVGSLASMAVEEDEEDRGYAHDPIESDVDLVSVKSDPDIKELHMEITTLPNGVKDTNKEVKVNASSSRPVDPADIIRHRAIKMEVEDDL